ncbi:endonuclease [Sphingomonas sp. AP4-R1]|uniref:Rid family hydrolase n=1 Tax=Sphingomonas sp. AP4-R1 TaxID=2735134 RepID=UPI001493DA04|nr:Rid family hydrolase [Sphingomonas sp. AP4-R1]QJU59457.1 endonuclease [Sphingomonas sp. AP4-R1]
MNKLVASSILALAALGATAAPAAGIVRNTLPAMNGKPARILESAEVPAGATTLYVSGQLASPVDPAKPTEFGDTKTQALSALAKIKGILEKRGYAMSDIFKMTLFLAPDPKLGKMDFEGVNAAFETFFNVPSNPNTVARSAVQVGALAGPNFLVEIEVTAAKVK